jgi:hypothetical protein
VLNGDDLHALVRLQEHWDGWYSISVIEGEWRARRLRGAPMLLTAPDARKLWDLLRDDYAGLAEAEALQQAGRAAEGGSL